MLFGDQLLINVKTGVDEITDEPTWSPLGYFDGYKASASREIKSTPVFGRSTPVKRPGKRSLALAFSGYLAADDAAQQAILVAEKAGEMVDLQILHDGTNGFECSGYPLNLEFDVSPEEAQAMSFDFEVDGETEAVGDGPAL